ncbi:unnamed protein product [Discosporangium mesarthrocarpum]
MTDQDQDGGRHLYAVHCIDDASCGRKDGTPRGGSVKRMDNYPAHTEYQRVTADPQSPNFITKLAAGPMTSDNDKWMVGSLFLVESTRKEAEEFAHNDPFFKEKVWQTINIFRYVAVGGGIKQHRGNL